MNSALALLLVAAAGSLIGFAAWNLARLFAKLAARSKSTWDDDLATALALPLAMAAGVLAAGAALGIAAPSLPHGLVRELQRAGAALFVVAVAWAVLRLLRLLLDRATKQRPRFQPAARVSARLVSVVLYAMAILTVLSQYGISITPLLTGLGIAALAVALALQDTLANFFAGIWIQTGQPLQPGHYVRLEVEKLEGYVEQVGWRTTRIRTLAGNTVVLTNNKLAQAVVTDYYLPSPDMAVSLVVRAAFENEPEHVIAVLLDEARGVAKGNRGVVQDVEPSAQLNDIGPDAYLFEVGLRVTEYAQQYAVLNALRQRILARFRVEGIRIPYPTRHNIQEPVAPPAAQRLATAPGGFAPPHGRPKRPKAVPKTRAPPPDPRAAEAEKARSEIAQHQVEKAEAEAAGEPVPEPATEPAPGPVSGEAAAPRTAPP